MKVWILQEAYEGGIVGVYTTPELAEEAKKGRFNGIDSWHIAEEEVMDTLQPRPPAPFWTDSFYSRVCHAWRPDMGRPGCYKSVCGRQTGVQEQFTHYGHERCKGCMAKLDKEIAA